MIVNMSIYSSLKGIFLVHCKWNLNWQHLISYVNQNYKSKTRKYTPFQKYSHQKILTNLICATYIYYLEILLNSTLYAQGQQGYAQFN